MPPLRPSARMPTTRAMFDRPIASPALDQYRRPGSLGTSLPGAQRSGAGAPGLPRTSLALPGGLRGPPTLRDNTYNPLVSSEPAGKRTGQGWGETGEGLWEQYGADRPRPIQRHPDSKMDPFGRYADPWGNSGNPELDRRIGEQSGRNGGSSLRLSMDAARAAAARSAAAQPVANVTTTPIQPAGASYIATPSGQGSGDGWATTGSQGLREAPMPEDPADLGDEPTGQPAVGFNVSGQGLLAEGAPEGTSDQKSITTNSAEEWGVSDDWVNQTAESLGLDPAGLRALLARGYIVDENGQIHRWGKDENGQWTKTDDLMGWLKVDEYGNPQIVEWESGAGGISDQDRGLLQDAFNAYNDAIAHKPQQAAGPSDEELAFDEAMKRLMEMRPPEPDRAALERMISAQRRREAYDAAVNMRIAMQGAANSGAAPGYGSAVGTDIMLQQDIASQGTEAQARLAFQDQQYQAQLAFYQQQINAAQAAMAMAHDEGQAARAFEYQQVLMKLQGDIQKEYANFIAEQQSNNWLYGLAQGAAQGIFGLAGRALFPG